MQTLRLLSLLSLVSTVAASSALGASDRPADERRGFVFPTKKQRAQAHPVDSTEGSPPIVVQEGEGPPDPNAPAVEPPGDDLPRPDEPAAQQEAKEGIWDWVDRMEGEVPSPEQVEALQEVTEEQSSERALIDDLSGAPVNVRFYDDPAASLAVDPLFLDLVDAREFDIPIEVNPLVEKWVRYFTGSGRKYFTKWLSRSPRFQPMMQRALAEAGLPQDLVYLSMIESGYNAHAYSHAEAAGLWQFIPSTGKLYDLRVDWWVDDRRDPEDSLKAAIAFLSELHNMFGDWRLAWAAYNGGPGRVRRAIQSTGTKDFWKIADSTALHPETDNYVPKIMAAAIIAKHPERYGFTGLTYEDELVYETAHVEGAVELEVLARCAGTTLDEIKALNPALRRYATPVEGYEVRLPVGHSQQFVAALAEVPLAERVTVVRHTVRRGETLSIIAARYHTTVADVSRANNLRNVNRIYVGMNLVMPHAEGGATPVREDVTLASVRPVSTPARAPAKPRPSTHVVTRGESLSAIASRYGTTISSIQSANGLRSSTILVGQRLTIPNGSSSSREDAAPARPSTHVVRKGETLAAIAGRYGVSPSDLQRWNGIRDASHIEVGQSLSVSGTGGRSDPQPSWTTYVVRRGDSLGAIADRNGCTVGELRQWNELASSVIHPGQKLRISKG